jgi:hypothetical protein
MAGGRPSSCSVVPIIFHNNFYRGVFYICLCYAPARQAAMKVLFVQNNGIQESSTRSSTVGDVTGKRSVRHGAGLLFDRVRPVPALRVIGGIMAGVWLVIRFWS